MTRIFIGIDPGTNCAVCIDLKPLQFRHFRDETKYGCPLICASLSTFIRTENPNGDYIIGWEAPGNYEFTRNLISNYTKLGWLYRAMSEFENVFIVHVDNKQWKKSLEKIIPGMNGKVREKPYRDKKGVLIAGYGDLIKAHLGLDITGDECAAWGIMEWVKENVDG